MRLQSLILENFRSYISCELQFFASNDLTIFVGKNAQGKTNLLESIALLALPRSFRTRNHRDLVHFDKEYYRVQGKFHKRCFSEAPKMNQSSTPLNEVKDGAVSTEYEIFFQKKPKVEKALKSNGTFKTLQQYVGQVHAVLFSPETMNLLFLGPVARRKFLNMMLCQTDKNYLQDLLRYQKALKSRNILLKRIHGRKAQAKELAFWNSLLAETGASIIIKRLQCVQNLALRLSEMYQSISGSSVQLVIRYSNELSSIWREEHKSSNASRNIPRAFPNISCGTDGKSIQTQKKSFTFFLEDETRKETMIQRYLEELEKRFQRDLTLKKTTFGPHQDDLHFYMNEKPLEKVGSRGECRTAILALKMAELKCIEEISGEKPIFLLDDVFSELDSERQKRLLESMQSYQTIVTATHFPEEMRKNGKIQAFRIEDSTIKKW
ncbi:DNA replication/repair protein RecF [Candidatus Peregrinibacteria bacterium]|nr:DNA replication/repair protein RecF [Candidatus Peregrinibacteria bacterium]